MRVVLSSVDGSLLDPQTDGFGVARQALAALERRDIPLVLFGHRTRAQLEALRQQLRLEHPFISEDGGAVYLPEHYFPDSILDPSWLYLPPYFVRPLGLPYERLRQILQEVRSALQAALVGFGDWRTEELAVALGTTVPAARLAQQREYSEIFTYSGDPERLQQALAQQEQQLLGYRLALRPLPELSPLHQWYLRGVPAEPDPVPLILECYRRHLGEVDSLGIATSLSELSLLRHAGCSVMLPGPHQESVWAEAGPHWRRANLPGPAGWNEAVLTWLEETDGDDV